MLVSCCGDGVWGGCHAHAGPPSARPRRLKLGEVAVPGSSRLHAWPSARRCRRAGEAIKPVCYLTDFQVLPARVSHKEHLGALLLQW